MSDKAEKYAQWIVDNKDKKGTPEFETVAKAYKLAKEDVGLTVEQVKAQNSIFPESLFGSRAISKPTTAGEMLQRQDPIAAGEMAEVVNVVGGKNAAKNVAQRFNVNPEDARFKAGKLATDIGVSYAVPALLGKAAGAIPQAAKYAELLGSGGMTMGKAATGSKIANALMRGATGAAEGYGTGQLINPDEASTGAMIQGALAAGNPLIGEMFKRGGNRLMTMAVKPDTADFESGAAQKAIQSMLEEGVNPTPHRTIFGKGLDTVQAKISDLNNQVKNMIANSNGNVSKQDVLNALDSYAQNASKQLAPDADLAAIKAVREQIVGNRQMPTNYVPVQTAQELKQGTYKAVGERAYGQESTAAKEAQKVGARALKEGIEKTVPEVAPINAQESNLINMLDVVERKAYAALRNNPAGLSLLSPNDLQGLAMMADRSAPFKALLGRILYQTGNVANKATQLPVGTAPAAIATQGEQ